MLTYDPKNRPSASQVLSHPWFTSFKGKKKADKKIAQSALDNMKRFKRNKQFEQATISFIINQLITKEERAELMKQFTEWDKNGDGVTQGYLNIMYLGSGYFAFYKDKAYGVINAKDKVIIENKYVSVESYSNNVFVCKQNGFYGLVNKRGKEVSEFI